MKKQGQPTLYTDDTPQKVMDYMSEWEKLDQVIPSVAGLALYLGVGRTTIYGWAATEGREDFSNTLEQLQAKQEQILLNKGLSSEFNSTITKLALSNHGYSDKVDSTLSAPGGGPLAVATSFNFIPVGSDD